MKLHTDKKMFRDAVGITAQQMNYTNNLCRKRLLGYICIEVNF
jgi:hypothetical protein